MTEVIGAVILCAFALIVLLIIFCAFASLLFGGTKTFKAIDEQIARRIVGKEGADDE